VTAPDDDSMVERVAKAIYQADGFMLTMCETADESWAKDRDDVRERYRLKARAAIAAMREPTVAMIDAGFVTISSQKIKRPRDPTSAYKHMIHTALL